MSPLVRTGAFALPLLFASSVAWADEGGPNVQVIVDTLWVVVAGILVFFMNAGFALLESGFCRAKNAVNILAKNFSVAAMAGLSFFFFGFGLMFAEGTSFIGTQGFLLMGADNSPALNDAYSGIFPSLSWAAVPIEAKFFFQACFAMAAASIVSGAVAERIKFQSFLAFAFILVAVIYSITGHWIWGGGWLGSMGFWDFAGSTQVHSVGGWAALTGAFLLGPRIGKYDANGKVKPIPGHNMALATTGGFILWLGWFGFNAGSTMAADPTSIAHIATTTLLASLAGIAGALITAYIRTRSFDLSMMINGCLAGLVGITAPCAWVGDLSSIVIGLIAGALVVIFVEVFDALKIDDPVGATSVHLVCGIWGTLAVGIFAEAQYSSDVGDGLLAGGGATLLINQLIGIAAVGAFVVISSSVVWLVVRAILGLRASEEEELLGLDITEMKMRAYASDDMSGMRSIESAEHPTAAAVAQKATASE